LSVAGDVSLLVSILITRHFSFLPGRWRHVGKGDSNRYEIKDPNLEAYKMYFPAELLFSPTFRESIKGQLTQDVVITGKGNAFLAAQQSYPDFHMFCPELRSMDQYFPLLVGKKIKTCWPRISSHTIEDGSLGVIRRRQIGG
jgi:hypothetical protein